MPGSLRNSETKNYLQDLSFDGKANSNRCWRNRWQVWLCTEQWRANVFL